MIYSQRRGYLFPFAAFVIEGAADSHSLWPNLTKAFLGRLDLFLAKDNHIAVGGNLIQ